MNFSIADWVTGIVGVILAIGLIYYKWKAGSLEKDLTATTATNAVFAKSAGYQTKRLKELQDARDRKTIRRIKEAADEGTRYVAAHDLPGVADYMRRGIEASGGGERAGSVPGATPAEPADGPPVPVRD